MKRGFFFEAILISLILGTVVVLLAPLVAVVHEYSHLLSCELIGGEGKVYLEWPWIFGSYANLKLPENLNNYAWLTFLSGGLGVFVLFGILTIMIRALRQNFKRIPEWLIIGESALFFWAMVSLFRAIIECFLYRYLRENNIFLSEPEAWLANISPILFAAFPTQQIYLKKIFDWYFNRKKAGLKTRFFFFDIILKIFPDNSLFFSNPLLYFQLKWQRII